MIALWLALVLPLLQSEPVSTRCWFTGSCAAAGECDDHEGKLCVLLSHASCAASRACVEFGDCRWMEGKGACEGNDPADCAPDSAACRLFGNCKAGTPGMMFCQPTRDGCKQSELCRTDGLCVLGRSEVGTPSCVATTPGCKASYDCKLFGDCVAKGTKGQLCSHDPKACPGTIGCREHGTCTSNGGVCAFLSDDDCARGRVCTTYGKCALKEQRCDPADRECAPAACVPKADCAASEICKGFGACHATEKRCVVQPNAATCTKKRKAAIASVAASTTGAMPGRTFASEHLIDGRYDTAWAPGEVVALPHRLTLTLEAVERVAGMRFAAGVHQIDRKEGILLLAFGQPRGIAVRIGDKVHEVFELRRQPHWQAHDFAPVETDTIVLEVFDALPGKRYPSYGLTELEVLVCE